MVMSKIMNNMTQEKKSYILKWTWFIFSQISILLFGAFVGCWVTVGSRIPELQSGDPQIVLIQNLGIAFTVLFFIFVALTGATFYMYKKSKSSFRPQTNPTPNKNVAPTKQAPTIILNKTTNMKIPSMGASKLVAPSRTVLSSKPISPALAKPMSKLVSKPVSKPVATIPAKTVTPSSSKIVSRPTAVSGKPIGTTAKAPLSSMGIKPNIPGARK